MIVVSEVSPDDWAVLRATRLAALRDAPRAFASTYEREAPYTPEQWRGWIGSSGVTFLAHRRDIAEPAGLAGVHVDGGIPELISLWVRPTARGHRVGETLITAAADWTRLHDHATLFLWVTESNEPARRLYARCGFAPTGESQPVPSNPTLTEIRMHRPL